jgi:hypothetical protein
MTFIPILFTLNTFLLLASIGGYHYAKSIDPGFGSGSFGAGLVSVTSLLAGCLSVLIYIALSIYMLSGWLCLAAFTGAVCGLIALWFFVNTHN